MADVEVVLVEVSTSSSRTTYYYYTHFFTVNNISSIKPSMHNPHNLRVGSTVRMLRFIIDYIDLIKYFKYYFNENISVISDC